MHRNRLIVKCEQCSTELSKPPSLISKRNFCNMKCLGLYRREHPTNDASQMHTSKARINHKRSQELRDRMGQKNGMFGRYHSEETRSKMSDAKTQLIVSGKFRPYGTNNKKGWYTSKAGVEMFFKSSWEEATMKYLDANELVTTWEYEKLRIPYVYNNNQRWYVPDFVVTFTDGRHETWEVKPEQFLKTERVSRTINAGVLYCEQHNMNFRVFTGQVLKETGIIP